MGSEYDNLANDATTTAATSATTGNQIPVTVLNGSLGAGKTTILKHLVANSGLRIAGIINDLSETSVDLKLLSDPRVKVPLVRGASVLDGCICCTRRESFLNKIAEICQGATDIDYILVESCGVAEPLHVTEALSLVQPLVRLDTMATVLDALAALGVLDVLKLLTNMTASARANMLSKKTLARPRRLFTPEVKLMVEQSSFANVILISKCDQVGNVRSQDAIADLQQTLQRLNPKAKIYQLSQGQVAPSALLSTGLFSMTDAEDDPRWFAETHIVSAEILRYIPLKSQLLSDENFGGDENMPLPPSPAPSRGSKLPVVVLTGYLGAGKTTLLNYVLKEQQDQRLAVIENEIGEVSVDDAFVEQKHEDMAEELIVLDNGCVCCTIRGDLVNSLLDLAKKLEDGKVKLDGILIELTGAADPAPVVQTFFMDQTVSETFYIDNVIALVDCKHCIEKLDESKGDPKSKGTACAQIAFSSTVLLNKIDLVGEECVLECENRIKGLNSVANIIRCEQARVPLEKIFNVNAFDLASVLEEQYMDEEEFNSFYTPKMDRSISNVGVKFQGAINMHKFQELLNECIGEEQSALDFLRIKGVLSIQGSNDMFVLQCVHMLREQTFTKPWADRPRENRIIFIGRGMQERRQKLTEGVMACVAKPLRFKIGDSIDVQTGNRKYMRGKIIRHWDELNAYRIRLDNGDEVWAPIDEDRFVKAA